MAVGEPILNIVNSTMLDAGLTQIANAIRAKGGTSAQLAFPDGMAAAIAAIEAGGGGADVFHSEITPATSGEVITVQLADTARDVRVIVVRMQGTNFSGSVYSSVCSIGVVLGSPPRSDSAMASVQIGTVYYKSGNSWDTSSSISAMYYNSVPDGSYDYNSYKVWHGTTNSAPPTIKLFTTDGVDKKYGLLVGETYDVWAIF